MISKFWPYKEGGPVQILDSYYYCQIVFSDFCIAYLENKANAYCYSLLKLVKNV